MTKQQKAAFAAMSAAMAASDDSASAAAFAAEMSALSTISHAVNNGHSVPEVVFTPSTLAAFLLIPETVVVAEADAGRIPGRCVGGEWRFHRAAIERWLERVDGSPNRSRPVVGVGREFGEDPEAIIEAIYSERNRHPVRG